MYLNDDLIRIALVDICGFTKLGLDKMISSIDKNDNLKLNISYFDSLPALIKSNFTPDIAICDPFVVTDILENVDNHISLIKKKNHMVNIYVFSIAVGYVKPLRVDGMFNKKTSISDLISLLRLIIFKKSCCKFIISLPPTDPIDESLTLNNSEVVVLRGYCNNLKTKQIANHMGCDVKKIYYLKKKALDKIDSARNSSHYNNILRIFS